MPTKKTTKQGTTAKTGTKKVLTKNSASTPGKKEKEFKPPAKYVSLLNNNTWRLEVGGHEFCLSRTLQGQKHFEQWNLIPEEVQPKVRKAVDLGLLKFTDEPEKDSSPKKQWRPVTTRRTPRFEYHQLEKEEVKQNRQVPLAAQMSNGAMQASKEDAPIFKVLRNSIQEVMRLLPVEVDKLPTQGQKVAFVKRAKLMERAGQNTSFIPRRPVMDLLDELLVKLGEKTAALSDVAVEEDKDADPEKVVQIAV